MEKYDQILQDIKAKLKVEEFNLDSTLADLGLDSLDVVEFILDLEDNYGLTFEPSEAQSLKTLGDLVNLIKSKC